MLSDIIHNHKPVNAFMLRGEGFHRHMEESAKNGVRSVNEKNGWIKVTKCPVCEESERTVDFSSYGVQIVCCRSCTLHYSERIPKRKEDVYEADFFVPRMEGSYKESYEYRKQRFGLERIELIRGAIGKIEGCKILDVGSGSGYFLDCAKKNQMIPIGIELSTELRERSSREIGIKIYGCDIDELPEDEKFDVITMFDLIEHVSDPVGLLTKAREKLRKGGIIVVFTPNFDSFGIKVMREDSNLILPAEHLVYFTKKSLSEACTRAGLRSEYIATFGLDIADILSMIEEHANDGDTNLCNFLEKWQGELQAITNHAEAANHLRMICRKS